MTKEIDIDELVTRAKSGQEDALAELFALHRDRLRKMIELRMDARLKGRLDASDVLQECYIDLVQKLPAFARKENGMSMFVWMRLVAKERLLNVFRRQVAAEKRSVDREISIDQKRQSPDASSMILAEHLLGRFTTAGNHAIQKEMQSVLMNTLNSMEAVDHEIIMMRCFEGLSNQEAAESLNLSQNGASNRFVRAMTRLRSELEKVPGFFG